MDMYEIPVTGKEKLATHSKQSWACGTQNSDTTFTNSSVVIQNAADIAGDKIMILKS
jgi:hypothetical protein